MKSSNCLLATAFLALSALVFVVPAQAASRETAKTTRKIEISRSGGSSTIHNNIPAEKIELSAEEKADRAMIATGALLQAGMDADEVSQPATKKKIPLSRSGGSAASTMIRVSK